MSRCAEELLAMSPLDRSELLLSGIVDTGKSCEYGLLLGCNPIDVLPRCEWAAELYRNGRVKYIIASGGVFHSYKGRSVKECDFMAEMLEERGVPAESIILESEALTTKENMILGALWLNRRTKLVGIDEILIITSGLHMKRSLALAKAFLPRKVTPVGCPAPFAEDIEQWLTDENIQNLDKEISLMIELENNGIIEKNTLKI